MSNRNSQYFGFNQYFFSQGAVLQALNTSAIRFAMSFVPTLARNLNACRALIGAVSGTLSASDIVADLSDSTGVNGSPGAVVATGILPTSAITASGLYDFAVPLTAVNPGQQYWIIWRNVNASPASNYCSFSTSTFEYTPLIGIGPTNGAFASAASTNSGSTWSVGIRTNIRIGYDDGTYDGIILTGAPFKSEDHVFGTCESGVLLTTPPSAVLNVAGIAMQTVSGQNNPSGKIRFGLWAGSTPVNLGYTSSNAQIQDSANSGWAYAFFPASIAIQPGTTLRVTMGETANADNSSTYYRMSEIPWDTDASSLALLPFGGTLRKTYFNGTAWIDDTPSGGVFPFELILDDAAPFAGASGGVLSTPSMAGCPE